MPDLVMPRLSDSMEEGTIVRWLVEDGAEVHRGEEIVEIETDKATMTYEADGDGGERVKASPVARRIARERGVDLEALAGSGPGGRIVKADVEAAVAAPAA